MSLPDGWPAVYAEAGANYRAIDDLRLKLLALLPLATGTGIFLAVKPGSTPAAGVTGLAGLFGVAATISLFFYELHGVEKCAHFIHRGQQLEELAKIRGPFANRPHKIFGVVSELLPAAIVYPASFAGWVFVAAAPLPWTTPWLQAPYWLAMGALVVGLIAAGRVIQVRERSRQQEWELEDRQWNSGRPCPRTGSAAAGDTG